MEKVKTAVVGCGVISESYMKNLKNRFTIIELTACSDLDQPRMNARAEQFDISAKTYEEILSDPEIEMIVNLTNPAIHYQITKSALEAGKHIYSEKMLGITVKEAKELCDMADEKGLYLGVAPDTFLGGTIQTTAYLIEHGMIGKPLSFVASLTRDFGIFGEILPHLRKRGGSLAMDTGCYYLTALASMLGPVKKVAAFCAVNEAERKARRMDRPNFNELYTIEVENLLTASLQYENGVVGTFHINSDCIFDESRILTIYGTEGILTIDDPNQFASRLTLQKPFSEPAEFPLTHGFTDECRGIGAAEMAWSIRKERVNRACKEMGYHVLEVLEGMIISSNEERVYSLKSSFQKPQMLPAGYVSKPEYGMWAPTEETALA